MNPYALRRKHLKLVRLPISPPPHWGNRLSISKAELRRKPPPERVLSQFEGIVILRSHGRRRTYFPFVWTETLLLKECSGVTRLPPQHANLLSPVTRIMVIPQPDAVFAAPQNPPPHIPGPPLSLWRSGVKPGLLCLLPVSGKVCTIKCRD